MSEFFVISLSLFWTQQGPDTRTIGLLPRASLDLFLINWMSPDSSSGLLPPYWLRDCLVYAMLVTDAIFMLKVCQSLKLACLFLYCHCMGTYCNPDAHEEQEGTGYLL